METFGETEFRKVLAAGTLAASGLAVFSLHLRESDTRKAPTSANQSSWREWFSLPSPLLPVAYAAGTTSFSSLPANIAKQTQWDYHWNPNRGSKGGGSYNILLVRHGQYHYGERDSECVLTPLGHQQAALTGQYLRQLNLPFSRLVYSTMARAVETVEGIMSHMPNVPVDSCDLLREGEVYPPEPGFVDYHPSMANMLEDNRRVEEAFRKYFMRGPTQRDTYEVLVCHGNVIRYLLCRALQLPPEAWSRFSLDHGSVTWIVVRPDGSVTCRMFAGSSHIPADKSSFY